MFYKDKCAYTLDGEEPFTGEDVEMNLTDEIREYALSIGFAKVGFTDTEDFSDYPESVKFTFF